MSAVSNSVAQQIEDLEDERDDYAAMLARMEAANEESIPLDVVRRLSNGEEPVKVWREYRGLSEQELSKVSGVDVLTIFGIEKAEYADRLSRRDLACLARALRVDLDMLVPWSPEGEPRDE